MLCACYLPLYFAAIETHPFPRLLQATLTYIHTRTCRLGNNFVMVAQAAVADAVDACMENFQKNEEGKGGTGG